MPFVSAFPEFAAIQVLPFVPTSGRRRCNVKFNAGLLLKIANDVEKIARLGVAAGAEHTDQALGLSADRPAEFLETYRRLYVVPQDNLSRLHIASQHQVYTFT